MQKHVEMLVLSSSANLFPHTMMTLFMCFGILGNPGNLQIPSHMPYDFWTSSSPTIGLAKSKSLLFIRIQGPFSGCKFVPGVEPQERQGISAPWIPKHIRRDLDRPESVLRVVKDIVHLPAAMHVPPLRTVKWFLFVDRRILHFVLEECYSWFGGHPANQLIWREIRWQSHI